MQKIHTISLMVFLMGILPWVISFMDITLPWEPLVKTVLAGTGLLIGLSCINKPSGTIFKIDIDNGAGG